MSESKDTAPEVDFNTSNYDTSSKALLLPKTEEGDEDSSSSSSSKSRKSHKIVGTSKLSRTRILVIIVFLVGFQLLHNFDPAQPFTVQIAVDLGLTNEDLFNTLSPFRAYFLLPSSLLVGLLYELIGYRFALCLLFLALFLNHGLQCIAVLLRPDYATTMLLYRVAYYFGSYSFATGFVVNCSMFSLLPPSAYQAASSANSIAMMVGSLLASFAGQGIVHVVPHIGDLFYISLGITAAALGALGAGVCAGALPRAERVMSTREWFGRVWEKFVFYHKCSDVLEWSIFSAVNLALHTLVKNMWKSLFHDIDPESGQFNNGLINGVTCLAAAVCMFVMSLLPRATERAARSILCLFPFVNGLVFIAMALSPTVLVGTCFFVAYNALCECVLVLGNVMMAKAMGRAEKNALKAQSQKISLNSNDESNENNDENVEKEKEIVVDENGNENENNGNDEEEEEMEAKARKLVDFTLVFTVNYCVSIIVQNVFNALAVLIAEESKVIDKLDGLLTLKGLRLIYERNKA